MASGFVAVVALRKNSDFSEFDPSKDRFRDDYEEQAAIFLDDEVASSFKAIDSFLRQTFESGNVGSLRDRLTRSLSVGDIVKIEHVRTGKLFIAAVDKVGWSNYMAV